MAREHAYVGLHDQVGRWLFVHVTQLVLAPFVAFALWTILRGINSIAGHREPDRDGILLVSFSVYDWLVVVITAAFALSRAGASRATTAATAASGLIALHGGVPATIGFAALAAATVLRHRERTRTGNTESHAPVTMP